MRLTKALTLLTVSLAVACGEDAGDSAGANGALSASDNEFEEVDDSDGEPGEPSGGEDDDDDVDLDEVECPRGGDTGPIYVDFDCDEVEVVTCKDLSNIVLELADGSHVKYQGQKGHLNSFTDAQPIVGVWVKAGDNASGDGPGYGERFDAPADSCAPPGEPDGSCECEEEPADGDTADGDAADGDPVDGDADGDPIPPDLY